MKRGQIVLVEWDDVYSDSRWLDSEQQEEFVPAQIQSVGIVLSCDKKVLKLAHNVNLDSGESDLTVYPMGMIRKVTVLSSGKGKC